VIILKALLFTAVFLPITVLADVPAEQVKEVNHLIAFINNSRCIINRNGTDYPAKKALEHIKRKYDYFRDDIKKTEDFIKYSATKSTLSGEYYTAKCPGEETIQIRDWLLAELERYRSGRHSDKIGHSQSDLTLCPVTRPGICTREYKPVCATLQDGSVKTYSNGCAACSDTNVVSYKTGDC